MFHHTPFKKLTMALIILGLIIYARSAGYFGQELIVEVAVLAILAIGLDILAGYTGMPSLCHGAIFGLAAYSFAIMTVILDLSPLWGIAAALIVPTLVGAVIGAVTSKVREIFFIMATLAFGQMIYVLVFDSASLGGDDGMAGLKRLDLSWAGIDFQNPFVFSFYAIFCLVLAYGIAVFVMRSGFGRTLCGIHSNEARMEAMGVNIRFYKSAAFAISGSLCGVAATVAAQHTMFVSPEMLIWTLSGEILIILILGGLGTLTGAVVGAVVLVFLKHEVSSVTHYWNFIIGLILVMTVFSGGRGIYGQLEHVIIRRVPRFGGK